MPVNRLAVFSHRWVLLLMLMSFSISSQNLLSSLKRRKTGKYKLWAINHSRDGNVDPTNRLHLQLRIRVTLTYWLFSIPIQPFNALFCYRWAAPIGTCTNISHTSILFRIFVSCYGEIKMNAHSQSVIVKLILFAIVSYIFVCFN